MYYHPHAHLIASIIVTSVAILKFGMNRITAKATTALMAYNGTTYIIEPRFVHTEYINFSPYMDHPLPPEDEP